MAAPGPYANDCGDNVLPQNSDLTEVTNVTDKTASLPFGYYYDSNTDSVQLGMSVLPNYSNLKLNPTQANPDNTPTSTPNCLTPGPLPGEGDCTQPQPGKMFGLPICSTPDAIGAPITKCNGQTNFFNWDIATKNNPFQYEGMYGLGYPLSVCLADTTGAADWGSSCAGLNDFVKETVGDDPGASVLVNQQINVDHFDPTALQFPRGFCHYGQQAIKTPDQLNTLTGLLRGNEIDPRVGDVLAA